MGVSTLAATASAPLTGVRGGFDATRLLRALLSLALAAAVLAIALPAAFGSGLPAGADPSQLLATSAPASVQTAGIAQLSASGLVPGEGRTSSIRVANGGGSAAAFTLGAQLAGRSGALARALVIDVRGASGAELYRGSLAGLSRVGLGTLPAGAVRTYRVTVALAAGAGNALAGSSLGARLVWSAA
jgi:hypothetical protein